MGPILSQINNSPNWIKNKQDSYSKNLIKTHMDKILTEKNLLFRTLQIEQIKCFMKFKIKLIVRNLRVTDFTLMLIKEIIVKTQVSSSNYKNKR